MGMIKDAAADVTASAQPVAENVAPEAQESFEPGDAEAQEAQDAPDPAADPAAADPGGGAMAVDGEAGGGMPTADEGDEQATPEEQAAYERAFRALNKIMYVDQKSSQAVFDMLQPEDKVGSVTRAALMLIKQLDDKLDMPETIIAQISQDTVEQLCDLGERAKQMPLSEQEQQQAMGSTWEGVMELFGQPVEEMRQFAQASQKDAQKGMPEVQSALNGQPSGAAERRRMPMQGA